MVSVDKAVIARLKKGGSNFEVLVDCDLAVALKEGKSVDMTEVLASEDIFADSKKGLKASENQVKQIFDTDNPAEAAKEIILKGDVQITAEHKAKLVEEKRKQIVNNIHVNGVNPKTSLPHPPSVIESAFEEAKIHVNEFEPVERQVQQILKKIQAVLPIRFETKEISIHVPTAYANKTFPAIKGFGNLTKNEWQNDGSWNGVIELPAGMQDDFFDKVNELTQGNATIEVTKTK